MLKKISNNLQLIIAKQKHIKDIVAIEKKSSPHPWTTEFFISELSTRNSFFLVCVDKNDKLPVGYLIFRDQIDFFEINNIVVIEEFRKKGIGRGMMDYLFEFSKDKGINEIFLEVRESNTGAINFYNRLGFQVISRRESYYKNPTEDALILKKII